jgi:hypothetical protein
MTPHPVPDITESAMFLFLPIIFWMGHDNMKEYCSATEQFFSPPYGKTMRQQISSHS